MPGQMATDHSVTFTDPKSGATYVWPFNPGPDGVTQPQQKQRQIDRTSNTGNVGAVKQQGDDGSYIIHWETHVYHRDHETALWEWYAKCQFQTIYLTDWAGRQYEGQIITLGQQDVGVIAGPGDATERGFYLKCVFEFEVYRFITGPMADANVTP